MRITSEYLKSLNACKDQVLLFEKTFPQGTTITQRSCKKAALAGLSLCWLAAKLFDAPALKQFNEAYATIRKQYYEAMATAQKQFNEAYATIRKQFNEAYATAQKQFNEAIVPALKQYDEAIALAFYNAWKKGKQCK